METCRDESNLLTYHTTQRYATGRDGRSEVSGCRIRQQLLLTYLNGAHRQQVHQPVLETGASPVGEGLEQEKVGVWRDLNFTIEVSTILGR